MKWEIRGTVINTGKQGRWQIEAATRGDAEDMAVENGVFAASIVPVVEDLVSEGQHTAPLHGAHGGDALEANATPANVTPAPQAGTPQDVPRSSASSSSQPAAAVPSADGGAGRAGLRTVAVGLVALCVGLIGGYFLGSHAGHRAAPGEPTQAIATPTGGEPASPGDGAQGGQSGDLLKDSGKPGSWNASPVGAARVALTGDKDGLLADVTAVDGVDWHAQMTQDNLSLQDGTRYALRFRAKADAPREIAVAVTAGPPDYHNLGLQRLVALGNDWKQFEFRFRAAKPQQGTNRLGFLLGQSKGRVSLSDISLSPASAGDNLLLPTAQAESWFLAVSQPAKATMAVDGNALVLDVTQPGSVDWHVQAMQTDVDVREGKRYMVKFRAKAEAPGAMGAYAAVSEGDFHSIGLAARADVGTNWKDYQYEFTATKTVPGLNRLSFAVGTFKGKVYLQDATLQLKGG